MAAVARHFPVSHSDRSVAATVDKQEPIPSDAVFPKRNSAPSPHSTLTATDDDDAETVDGQSPSPLASLTSDTSTAKLPPTLSATALLPQPIETTQGLPPREEMGWYEVSRGIFLGFFLVINSVLVNFTQFLFWPVHLASPSAFRSWTQHTERYFSVVLLYLTQWLAPTQLVITREAGFPAFVKHRGEPPIPSDPTSPVVLDGCNVEFDLGPEAAAAIVIANHQVYMDWIYLWFVAYYAGYHGAIKIILKASLRKVPIFGWAMQFYRFIFLQRQWAQDRRSFLDQIASMRADNTPQSGSHPYWITLFPEGTTISSYSIPITRKFAEAEKLPIPDHVLIPRATGLYHIVHALRGQATYVYDLTLGCEGLSLGQIPQDTFTIPRMYLGGRQYPRRVHVHFRRVALADIPEDADAFTEWLRTRWTEKDELMRHFYTHGHFPNHFPSTAHGAREEEEGKEAGLSRTMVPATESEKISTGGGVATAINRPDAVVQVRVRSIWELGQLWCTAILVLAFLRWFVLV
ncbi:hypothetical protein IWQ60_009609 [Tieghemiomyces parasiticus]|uniref:Phospholipid/glycerol acyltransferase domain-containing protein n=1 Tax=Tieghemiomyces parasiticus TaxID=78921 RepID=A0A9W7ZNV3_9FUNG|nr:hypothetical protein IWQ60_009609 [Tieghemiomyces parasiticus]